MVCVAVECVRGEENGDRWRFGFGIGARRSGSEKKTERADSEEESGAAEKLISYASRMKSFSSHLQRVVWLPNQIATGEQKPEQPQHQGHDVEQLEGDDEGLHVVLPYAMRCVCGVDVEVTVKFCVGVSSSRRQAKFEMRSTVKGSLQNRTELARQTKQSTTCLGTHLLQHITGLYAAAMYAN